MQPQEIGVLERASISLRLLFPVCSRLTAMGMAMVTEMATAMETEVEMEMAAGRSANRFSGPVTSLTDLVLPVLPERLVMLIATITMSAVSRRAPSRAGHVLEDRATPIPAADQSLVRA
jgi:hypothetical protein